MEKRAKIDYDNELVKSIMRFLLLHGKGYPKLMAVATGKDSSHISSKLYELEEAGLVKREKEGRRVFYSLTSRGIKYLKREEGKKAGEIAQYGKKLMENVTPSTLKEEEIHPRLWTRLEEMKLPNGLKGVKLEEEVKRFIKLTSIVEARLKKWEKVLNKILQKEEVKEKIEALNKIIDLYYLSPMRGFMSLGLIPLSEQVTGGWWLSEGIAGEQTMKKKRELVEQLERGIDYMIELLHEAQLHKKMLKEEIALKKRKNKEN